MDVLLSSDMVQRSVFRLGIFNGWVNDWLSHLVLSRLVDGLIGPTNARYFLEVESVSKLSTQCFVVSASTLLLL